MAASAIYSGGSDAAAAGRIGQFGQGFLQGLGILMQRAQLQSEAEKNKAYADWLEGRNTTGLEEAQTRAAGTVGAADARAGGQVTAADINNLGAEERGAFRDAYAYATNMGYNGAEAQDFALRTVNAMRSARPTPSSAVPTPGPPTPYALTGDADVMPVPSAPGGMPSGAPPLPIGSSVGPQLPPPSTTAATGPTPPPPGTNPTAPGMSLAAEAVLARTRPNPANTAPFAPTGAAKPINLLTPSNMDFGPSPEDEVLARTAVQAAKGGNSGPTPPAPTVSGPNPPLPSAGGVQTPVPALPDYLTEGPQKGGLLYSKAETADAAAQNANTKASVAPSQIAKNTAQAGLATAQTTKLDDLMPFLAPEAAAQVKLLNAKVKLTQQQAQFVAPLDQARTQLYQAQANAAQSLPWYRQGMLQVAEGNEGNRAALIKGTLAALDIKDKETVARIQQIDANDPYAKTAIDSMAIASKMLSDPLTAAPDKQQAQGIFNASLGYLTSRFHTDSMFNSPVAPANGSSTGGFPVMGGAPAQGGAKPNYMNAPVSQLLQGP